MYKAAQRQVHRKHYLCISYDDDGDGGDEEGNDIDDCHEDDSSQQTKG